MNPSLADWEGARVRDSSYSVRSAADSSDSQAVC